LQDAPVVASSVSAVPFLLLEKRQSIVGRFGGVSDCAKSSFHKMSEILFDLFNGESQLLVVKVLIERQEPLGEG
jgi:hypothetical protein